MASEAIVSGFNYRYTNFCFGDMMLLLTFLACQKVPGYLSDPLNNPHPDCDPKGNYWAVGLADTPKASIDQAHRAIAEQISSTIQSETELLTQYEEMVRSSNGSSQETSTAKELLNSSIRTETDFEKNDLIREVLPPMQYGEQYQTLSCLNRRETVKAMLNDMEAQMDQLRNLYDAAMDKAQDGNIEAFSSAYNQVPPLIAELAPDFYVIHSLQRRPSSQEQDMRSMRSQLNQTATEIRSDITIGLDFGNASIELLEGSATDLSEADKQRILDSVRLSLEAVGLSSLTGETECSDGLSHHGKVRFNPNCNRGGMGIICAPSIELRLQNCSSKKLLQIGIEHAKFSGQDFRSAMPALQEAIGKAKPELFVEGIHQKLANAIPLLTI
jgi:hypothetical protein